MSRRNEMNTNDDATRGREHYHLPSNILWIVRVYTGKVEEFFFGDDVPVPLLLFTSSEEFTEEHSGIGKKIIMCAGGEEGMLSGNPAKWFHYIAPVLRRMPTPNS